MLNLNFILQKENACSFWDTWRESSLVIWQRRLNTSWRFYPYIVLCFPLQPLNLLLCSLSNSSVTYVTLFPSTLISSNNQLYVIFRIEIFVIHIVLPMLMYSPLSFKCADKAVARLSVFLKITSLCIKVHFS